MARFDSYIICATPRSGSTLMCDLLADTGLAGRPDSFFREQSIGSWADYWHVPKAHWTGEREFDQAYLHAVHREGTAGGRVFGMRLMWESVGYLMSMLDKHHPGLPDDHSRLQAEFGSIGYVHLSRQDKVAQAISLIKAEQSGLWHRNADGSERERLKPAEDVAFDSERLLNEIAQYESDDAAWNAWFARHGIEPLRITYEALSERPQEMVARVLSAIGVDSRAAAHGGPRTAKLADNESRDWYQRLLGQAGDPNAGS